MLMGYTTNICVSSICKVDYIMADTFMYVVITLNYNKVMHIIPKSHRVANIAKC